VPLLDQPLHVEGSRQRKTVSRLSIDKVEKNNELSIPEGKGTKLGEIPRVELQIKVRNNCYVYLALLLKMLF